MFQNTGLRAGPAALPVDGEAEAEAQHLCGDFARTIAWDCARRAEQRRGARQTVPLGVFDSSVEPSITVGSYLERQRLALDLRQGALVHAHVYFTRICAQVELSPLNVHRLLAACVCVAHKFCEDVPSAQCVLARTFGVTARELGRLERAALGLLDWRLYVRAAAYDAACASLAEAFRAVPRPLSSSRAFQTPGTDQTVRRHEALSPCRGDG